MIPIFLLSVNFAITDNMVLRTINFFLVPLLLVGTFILITSPPQVKWFKFGFIKTIGNKYMEWFENIVTPYKDSFKKVKLSNINLDLLKRIGIGVGIGLVLALVIVPILASADMIFERYIKDFFNIIPETDLKSWFNHILVVVIGASLVGGLFYAILNKTTKQDDKHLKFDYLFDPLSTYIALGFLIVIYVLFGIVQFVYLFGVNRDIYDIGMTFSDYAVKGFWELVLVAFINLAIILAALFLTKFRTKVSKVGTKILLGVINVLTFILIYSAHLRLSLYEQTYGYTHSRLYAHATIVFLFILFVFLAYKIVCTKSSFTRAATVIWLVIYTVLNFINVEGLIANKNIERYENAGKLDSYYLNKLSADAIPAYIKLLEINDKPLAQRIDKSLRNKYKSLKTKIYDEPWHSFNLSRHRALDLLSQRYGEKN
ncbi:DUF4153 domain-containing protein [Patescibacteria group bacterium]